VLGRGDLLDAAGVSGNGEPEDELLLVDPPADASTRFKLEGRVAALFTGAVPPADAPGLPLVHTMPGGEAHVRVGSHLVDIFSLRGGTVVRLPALGLMCAGGYGSDALLPEVAPGSDGSAELDVLRLLARLVRERTLQLFIPRAGSLARDPVAVMERLADDVGYLHGLRRVVLPLAQGGAPLQRALDLAGTLLPANRRDAACRAANLANVERLLGAALS
jgi:hypothetical protein